MPFFNLQPHFAIYHRPYGQNRTYLSDFIDVMMNVKGVPYIVNYDPFIGIIVQMVEFLLS